MPKNKFLIVFGVFMTVIIVVGLILLNKTLYGRVLSLGVRLNTANFKITDVYSDAGGNTSIEWIVADSKTEKLFFGHSYPQDPGKYIDDKIFLLKDLYEPSQSPYPEVITNTIDCPAEFKPVKQDFGEGMIYKLSAGERFGYGICTNDLIKYDSFYGLFNCGEKGVFEIKIFGPKGDGGIEKVIKSFSCKN